MRKVRYKRILLLLPLAILLVMVIAPALLSIVPPSIPQHVLDYAKEHDLTIVERITESLYRLDDGQFLSFFEALPVSAGTNNFYGNAADGWVEATDPVYATCHDMAPAGEAKHDTDNYIKVGQDIPGDYVIRRAGVFFDTSAIEDEGVISAASLAVYMTFDNSDTDFYLSVVSGEDLSESGLGLWDYGDLLDADVIYGSIDTADMVMSTYNHVPLGVSGIDDINQTGYTKYGVRSANDIYSVAPTQPEWIQFSSFEKGVPYRPYLAVTYRIGEVPSKPTGLLCLDEEYPRTTDSTPYFSAIAHHPDDGEAMGHYAIYVDDNPAFGDLEWNSGQTVLATSIYEGERCEDITYAGTPLTWNTRYYWAIKFFDENEDEGQWSDASYFDFGVIGGGRYAGGEHTIFEPLEGDYYSTSCNPDLFLSDLFERAAGSMGYECSRPLYVLAFFIGAVGMSFGVMVASRSVVAAVIMGLVILAGGAVATVIPPWVPILVGAVSLGGWFVMGHTGV